jgi:hypothetical protein
MGGGQGGQLSERWLRTPTSVTSTRNRKFLEKGQDKGQSLWVATGLMGSKEL